MRRKYGRDALLPAICLAVLTLFLTPPASGDPALEWDDLYDGGALYIDIGTAALADADGHLIVGGESADGDGGADMLIRKLHRDTGAALWNRRVSSGEENDVALTGMLWDGSGDLLVAGYIRACVG